MKAEIEPRLKKMLKEKAENAETNSKETENEIKTRTNSFRKGKDFSADAWIGIAQRC